MKPEEHQSIAHIVALAPSVAPEPNFFQKNFLQKGVILIQSLNKV